VIVVDELFEQADGDKLGWYAPARERPVRIGSSLPPPSPATLLQRAGTIFSI
jgi:hypothetical protein